MAGSGSMVSLLAWSLPDAEPQREDFKRSWKHLRISVVTLTLLRDSSSPTLSYKSQAQGREERPCTGGRGALWLQGCASHLCPALCFGSNITSVYCIPIRAQAATAKHTHRWTEGQTCFSQTWSLRSQPACFSVRTFLLTYTCFLPWCHCLFSL